MKPFHLGRWRVGALQAWRGMVVASVVLVADIGWQAGAYGVSLPRALPGALLFGLMLSLYRLWLHKGKTVAPGSW